MFKSPCEHCKYKEMDKNYCKTLSDCPINIPTKTYPGHENRKRKECPVVGCKNRIAINVFCCPDCSSKMSYRKKIGVPPSIIFRHKLPKTWREKYGIYKWKRRKRTVNRT